MTGIGDLPGLEKGSTPLTKTKEPAIGASGSGPAEVISGELIDAVAGEGPLNGSEGDTVVESVVGKSVVVVSVEGETSVVDSIDGISAVLLRISVVVVSVVVETSVVDSVDGISVARSCVVVSEVVGTTVVDSVTAAVVASAVVKSVVDSVDRIPEVSSES